LLGGYKGRLQSENANFIADQHVVFPRRRGNKSGNKYKSATLIWPEITQNEQVKGRSTTQNWKFAKAKGKSFPHQVHDFHLIA
jgi:hypothetical protein